MLIEKQLKQEIERLIGKNTNIHLLNLKINVSYEDDKEIYFFVDLELLKAFETFEKEYTEKYIYSSKDMIYFENVAKEIVDDLQEKGYFTFWERGL